MNINEMHQRITLLKRQGQGAYHSREDIDKALNDASTDKYNEEKRQFEASSFISDNLSNFKTSGLVPFTAGFGPMPYDYDYRTNASLDDGTKVEIVPEGEWVERLNDPIDVVSSTNPICAIRDRIELVPSSLTFMRLYYLKTPTVMVFGYTEDADGNTIYNQATSTDCNWPASAHTDIILRALGYLGVSLPDQIMMNEKNFKKQTENV